MPKYEENEFVEEGKGGEVAGVLAGSAEDEGDFLTEAVEERFLGRDGRIECCVELEYGKAAERLEAIVRVTDLRSGSK